MEEKEMEQPGRELQELLDEIMEAEPEPVVFMGRKRKVGWLKKGTVRKFTHAVLKEKDEWKLGAKLCAIVLLNNVWKLRLWYWAYWRWLHYVKDLDPGDVLRLVNAAKKKIPQAPCSLVTILATGMKDVMMAVTREEAGATQAGRAGARRTR